MTATLSLIWVMVRASCTNISIAWRVSNCRTWSSNAGHCKKRNVVRIKTLTDLLKCHYQGIKRKGRRDGESTLFIHFCGICRAACRSKLFIIGLCISCKNLARALLWYDFCHFVSLFSLKEARIFHLKKSGFFQNIRLVILLHSIFHQVYIRPNLCKHGFSECLQVLS